ncbi:17767_t:CDS:1 [Gigaspora margarita]|uniref:17767_t:CDS:1 n=1 Tax=Gigaspora margarita TaxID=4874 RepID=A0ABN7U7B8_GIGMA|nr:17767_t:CDS:1 [Gigaspora margarita]
MNENSPVNDSEHTRKKHAEAEKRRRDEMNIRLDMLRKILASTPYPSNNVSKAELLQNGNETISDLRFYAPRFIQGRQILSIKDFLVWNFYLYSTCLEKYFITELCEYREL